MPEASRKGRPGSEAFRVALRDSLEAAEDLVGTRGVYTMTRDDHSGFDKRGRELMQWANGVRRLTRAIPGRCRYPCSRLCRGTLASRNSI